MFVLEMGCLRLSEAKRSSQPVREGCRQSGEEWMVGEQTPARGVAVAFPGELGRPAAPDPLGLTALK